MDAADDIRQFLSSRRARLTPEQAGLPTYGETRRVSGLRREEVALLAGVSVDYYARLERGRLAGASSSVLEGVSRALQLDEAEHEHLLALARNAESSVTRSRRPRAGRALLRPAIRTILDSLVDVPASVRTSHLDIIAANPLCQALYGGALDDAKLPVNLARHVFLDPQARVLFVDWDTVADDLVAALRLQAGKNPRDAALSNLVGELTTRTDEFSARWARHNVKIHSTARKRLHNAVVGDIELTGDALEFPGDDAVLIAYTAEPGSPAEEQLRLLASWAASGATTAAGATHPSA